MQSEDLADYERKIKLSKSYASVWIRFGALLIDGLIILPFYIPVYILLGVMESKGYYYDWPTYAYFIVGICYAGAIVFGIWNAMWRMGKTGQSLGRKFTNIAVLDQNGKPIGVGRAVLRETIGRFLSGVVCYIGYLNAFWDTKKQMWHDKIATCYVFYVDENYDGKL